MALLDVRDLSLEYTTPNGAIQAVEGVNFTLQQEDTLGIVGESGCGKTSVAKAILRILDDNANITSGEIVLEGTDLLQLSEEELRKEFRWTVMSYIPQNAMAALDPVYTVGSQVEQVIKEHTDWTKSAVEERTRELFRTVDLDPQLMSDYPHELSGGQRQRVTIALALALDPALIIADEPTTGLDVIVEEGLLDLFVELQEDMGCAIVFVTHDMNVVAEISDTIAVMYAGQIMEIGPTIEILTRDMATHPYTIGLKNAFPTMQRNLTESSLITIPGSPPDLHNPPSGCRFAERCPFETRECVESEPALAEVGEAHRSKCHYAEKASELRQEGQRAETWERSPD